MYKNLSKHGRFGDTEMVKTSSGSLWHVNKLEKKLIEEHGELGEQILDKMAPSTINPKTGKEEKWLAAAAMFGLGLVQQYGQTRATREQGRDQVSFYDKALASSEDAMQSLEEILGPSLQVVQEKGKRLYETAGSAYGKAIGKLRSSKLDVKKKQKFAKVLEDDEDIKEYREESQKKLEDIDIKISEDLSTVLSDFEKQRFDLMTNKQQLEMQRKLAERQSQQKYFGVL
tara:strand:+ start:292 stop:978 length:687 start_codon:yes stop_codon:yes gene_type:complete